jgi:hypothetical protein
LGTLKFVNQFVSKVLSGGCQRGRMGLYRPVLEADDARRSPTSLSFARSLQRFALCGQNRLSWALEAARLATVGCGLLPDTALAQGGSLRADRAGSAAAAALTSRTRGATQRRHSGQPHLTIDTGKRRAGGLRRSETTPRQQGSPRGRYARTPTWHCTSLRLTSRIGRRGANALPRASKSPEKRSSSPRSIQATRVRRRGKPPNNTVSNGQG